MDVWIQCDVVYINTEEQDISSDIVAKPSWMGARETAVTELLPDWTHSVTCTGPFVHITFTSPLWKPDEHFLNIQIVRLNKEAEKIMFVTDSSVELSLS